MTVTINPSLAERLQKAADEKALEPGDYLNALLRDTLPDAQEPQAAPYVRPTETPVWLRELAAQKNAGEGTGAMERVWGAWPGDETDEQIHDALEELS